MDERVVAGRGRRSRPEETYRAARRHTALVRTLRVAIPVVAVVAVVGVVAAPFLKPLQQLANVSIGSVGIENGKVRMDAPRLSGHRKDNRPYEVTAIAALQDVRNPTQIELDQLRARVQVEREGWVTVTARSGLFDSSRERLKLVDDVKVRTDSGYDVAMRTADIDFKAGTVNSREPVKVDLGTTKVEADSLDVTGNGAAISFAGRVRATIENAPAKALAGPERQGAAPQAAPAPVDQGAQAATPEPAAEMVSAPLPPVRPQLAPAPAVRQVYGQAATARNDATRP